MSRSTSGRMSKSWSSGSSRSRCCAVTATRTSKTPGAARNARRTGASLMSSGRVPKTTRMVTSRPARGRRRSTPPAAAAPRARAARRARAAPLARAAPRPARAPRGASSNTDRRSRGTPESTRPSRMPSRLPPRDARRRSARTCSGRPPAARAGSNRCPPGTGRTTSRSRRVDRRRRAASSGRRRRASRRRRARSRARRSGSAA